MERPEGNVGDELAGELRRVGHEVAVLLVRQRHEKACHTNRT